MLVQGKPYNQTQNKCFVSKCLHISNSRTSPQGLISSFHDNSRLFLPKQSRRDYFTLLFHFLASTSSSNTFLGQYSSLLEEADGAHLSRTITSISADPSNDEECAAYCHLANNGIY